MSVMLSERAAEEVRKIMSESNQPEGSFLRVGVAGGGCSGFSYALNFDSNFDEMNDEAYDCHGVRVVVDRKSELYLAGTTIEFYDEINRRGFGFNNPNATKSCGCGSSFNA